ncbi:membrane-bound alkaline phosphatase-like [Sabethes cyaneus]|uniref:membrane-bound alkaline phosphatase-like n=1 Tax=Sabethes cyaneus TaxID=53552 RepID=UPI00237E5008|nr:membrane-bound alkaline phosphatase-like [Sabethes cyaneus]
MAFFDCILPSGAGRAFNYNRLCYQLLLFIKAPRASVGEANSLHVGQSVNMKLLVICVTSLLSFCLAVPLEGNQWRQRSEDEGYHPSFPEDRTVRADTRNAQLEQTIDYWHAEARKTVAKLLDRKENRNIAKNVILFLGDGMSISTVSMSRVYAGGEEKELSFEKFPYTGMSKTYCVDYQVADSACTATAYLSGVKGNYATIGVNAQVPNMDCVAELDKSTHTHSIAEWAMDAGKDAGLVTTTRVTHASPAGIYAHTANRDWEDDAWIEDDGCDPTVLDDIAEQLVHGEVGKRLRVILGGGRRQFLDQTELDPEDQKPGKRRDGKNLIREWQELVGFGENRTYVWTKQELFNVDPVQTDRLLGLFESNHCAFNLDKVRNDMQDEPTLTEMVDRATDLLSTNENGFFLFVEGGRIDHAHHDNWGKLALDETVEFAKAVEFARAKFSEEDTLIVVTADHSHSVSFSGYPNRGTDITSAAGTSTDKLPYMTLTYANGLGFYDHMDVENKGRMDIRKMDTSADYFRYPATLPVELETHGGEDVAVYASGPWSHLFTGSYEQNAIPHMMAYASCIGSGLKACSTR